MYGNGSVLNQNDDPYNKQITYIAVLIADACLYLGPHGSTSWHSITFSIVPLKLIYS